MFCIIVGVVLFIVGDVLFIVDDSSSEYGVLNFSVLKEIVCFSVSCLALIIELLSRGLDSIKG